MLFVRITIVALTLAGCTLRSEQGSPSPSKLDGKIGQVCQGRGRIHRGRNRHYFTFDAQLFKDRALASLNFPLYGQEEFELDWDQNGRLSSLRERIYTKRTTPGERDRLRFVLRGLSKLAHLLTSPGSQRGLERAGADQWVWKTSVANESLTYRFSKYSNEIGYTYVDMGGKYGRLELFITQCGAD